jgi:hypothetical protein
MEPGGRYRYRSAQAITGVVACAVMLGCGRWGAHLRVPPLYLGDLLLAVAAAHLAVSRLLAGPRPQTAAGRGHPGIVVAAYLAWACFRFITGEEHGLMAVRDFAPYGYGLVALLSAGAYARSTATDRGRSLRFIEIALIFHLLWVVGSQVVDGTTPTGVAGTTLFTFRGEDGGILGVTACLFFLRYLQGGGAVRLLVVAASLGSMFAMTSRAAVLATLVGLTIIIWCYFVSARNTSGGPAPRKVAMAIVAPIALVAIVAVMPSTVAGSKLLVTLGVKEATNRVDASGLGTEQARSAAWERVRAYTTETALRAIVGVGFGPHFMIDSGASIALLSANQEDVRSPHNYFIGTFARLGLIGSVLLALMCVQVLLAIGRVQRFAVTDDLLMLAVIVPPMLLVEAAVGVILEAPFGAIPFFWFLGILLSRPLPPERLPLYLASPSSSPANSDRDEQANRL